MISGVYCDVFIFVILFFSDVKMIRFGIIISVVIIKNSVQFFFSLFINILLLEVSKVWFSMFNDVISVYCVVEKVWLYSKDINVIMVMVVYVEVNLFRIIVIINQFLCGFIIVIKVNNRLLVVIVIFVMSNFWKILQWIFIMLFNIEKMIVIY